MIRFLTTELHHYLGWSHKEVLESILPIQENCQAKREITNFVQKNGEDMYQAWAHFKQMLNACPHHMQTNEVLAHAFFEGLGYNARSLLNSAGGGQAPSYK